MSKQRYKEAYQEQSPTFHPLVHEMNPDFVIGLEEKKILRSLAQEVAEIAGTPEMSEKRKLWKQHNELQTDQPLIMVSPEVGWNEIITPKDLQCVNPLARTWENMLRQKIHIAKVFQDDQAIEDAFDVPYSFFTNGWGLQAKVLGDEIIGSGGAFQIQAALEDYEQDFKQLHFPRITIDEQQSNRLMETAQEIFDGVLRVRRHMNWHSDVSGVDQFVLLRGMENFMIDFVLDTDYLHKMMRLLTDGMNQRLDWMEQQGLLTLNNDGSYIGTGGLGWTEELPGSDFAGHVRTKDMWGCVQAQETVSVSPQMYGEFILPYHKEIAARFGLVYYGCCEPTDVRWEYVRQIPNLRRVSWSPWADPARVPELLGKKYLACIKPSPTPLAGSSFDEETMKSDAHLAVKGSKGGICEFIMKDNHTLGGDGSRLVEWVKTMRREIVRVYG